MDMIFATWIIRSLYRPASVKTVARDLAKYKLDFEETKRGEIRQGWQ
jgi:hypothetical protein